MAIAIGSAFLRGSYLALVTFHAATLRMLNCWKRALRANLFFVRELSSCCGSFPIYREEYAASDVREHPRRRAAIESGCISHLREYGSVLEGQRLNQIISSCSKSGAFDLGILFHSVVVKMGLHSSVYICTSLLDLYGKKGDIQSAERVFADMDIRNVVSWNSLISSYVIADCPENGIASFVGILRSGITPSSSSFSAALVCCSLLEAVVIGAQLHGFSLKAGSDRGVVVGTALIDMYSKCGNVSHSRLVFDQMQDKNIITWSCMIGGYAHNRDSLEAMALSREMLRLGVDLNHVTYNSLLSSFCSPRDYNSCRQVHSLILRTGFDANAYITVSLVTVYSRCGASMDDFLELCSGISKWDQISWNGIISGFSNLGLGLDALKCFIEMRRACVDTDHITFQSVLAVTGMLSAIEEGKQLHSLLVRSGYASDVCVQNGLVSMYARSGAIGDSLMVFSTIDRHDVISWNALLSGLAHHGHGRKAIELFEKMRQTEVRPDGTTFLAVLSASSHSGLVDKGLEYFELMRYSVSPRMEHYAAIVDLLGRAGRLKEAEDFIRSMPFVPGSSVYKALLSACLVHGNRNIAFDTAKILLERWPDDAATYLLLSKILVAGGYWSDVAKIRKRMCEKGVQKKPAYSWF